MGLKYYDIEEVLWRFHQPMRYDFALYIQSVITKWLLTQCPDVLPAKHSLVQLRLSAIILVSFSYCVLPEQKPEAASFQQ